MKCCKFCKSSNSNYCLADDTGGCKCHSPINPEAERKARDLEEIEKEIGAEHDKEWQILTEEVIDVDSYRQGLMFALNVIKKGKV